MAGNHNALVIGPQSGRITVTGNNFSDSYIGEGAEKRRSNDQAASGLVLRGAYDVTVSGNSFAGLSTSAVSVQGGARRILFGNNTLTEVESEHEQATESLAVDNIAASPGR